MAHKVVFTVPERPLGKADVVFKVKREGAVLGHLKVSNGSVVWKPRKAQRGFKISWKKFDKLMQENGTRV